MRRWMLILLLALPIATLFLGRYWGRKTCVPEVVRDTILVTRRYREMPVLSEVVIGSVPLIFFPSKTDTLILTDTIATPIVVDVDVVSRTFGCEDYTAWVSGPYVGGRGPSLDSLDIVRRDVRIVDKPNPWEVSAVACIGVMDVFLGGGLTYHWERFSAGCDIGYEFIGGRMNVRAMARYRLF